MKEDHLNQESALQDQQELLENSLPAAFSAYDLAKGEGMADPVVFLLDCEDEIGGEIARSWLGDEAVEDAIEQRRLDANSDDEGEEGLTTLFAHAFPLEKCREEVPAIFPYLEPVFHETLPRESFLTIVVTCGGASALTVPFSAREES